MIYFIRNTCIVLFLNRILFLLDLKLKFKIYDLKYVMFTWK